MKTEFIAGKSGHENSEVTRSFLLTEFGERSSPQPLGLGVWLVAEEDGWVQQENKKARETLTPSSKPKIHET